MVCNSIHCFFNGFTVVFGDFQWFWHGFHCSFNDFQWFLWLSQWFCNGFHCSFKALQLFLIAFSMISQWFSLLLIEKQGKPLETDESNGNHGEIIEKAIKNHHPVDFSMGGGGSRGASPPHRKVTRVLVFIAFIWKARKTIGNRWKQWKPWRNHWKSN